MGGPIVGDADDERDRQATVTDFVDYTEHLPADVERSLTLLREQDELAQNATESLHRLLAQYAQLAADHDAYEAAQMRKEIACLLDMIRRRRESATAEAHRLHEEAVRHHNRLQNVKEKLLALPTPPSRDPTPQPAQKSPQAKRNEAIRLNLKVDSHVRSALPKRRMIVPGEVLPPWNPDSPVSSDYDALEDDDDEDDIIIPMPTVVRKKERIKLPKIPREPKVPKEPKLRKEKPPRLPGQVGTNVHSSVAGISTSNALSLLTPPPDDARPGSKFAPWFRLTEWEMATLRKRMKKNAIWAPSDTMIRRELVDKGRGHEAYQKAKRMAEEAGDSLLDEDDIQGQLNGLRDLRPGEISADAKIKATVTVNKGMDLNVRKKEKKAMIAQQQAAQIAQQNADLTNQSLVNLSHSFKTLFDKPDVSPSTPTDSLTGKGSKRKRESGISPDLQLQAQLNADNLASPTSSKPAQKRQKGAPSTPKTMTTTTTTTVPTAPPAPSPAKPSSATKTEPGIDGLPASANTRKAASNSAAATTARRMSLTLHMPRADSKPSDPIATGRETRQSSRPSSARASAGPLDGSGLARQSPRLKSATPGPTPTSTIAVGTASAISSSNNTITTTAGAQRERRSKRPAPGPVTANQEGGASVTVGRRKNAPKKRGKLNVEEGRKHEEYVDEDVDPDEPRYCICNNVSYGTMIQCENPHCEGGEWFHLDCVRLKEPPGRREKWWCPKCDTSRPQSQRRR